MPISIADLYNTFTERFAYSGNLVEYVGRAHPGSVEGDEVWQIQRLTYSGNNVTEKKFADGSMEFKFSWTDRAKYNYS